MNKTIVAAALLLITGCAGIRQTDNTFQTQAMSLHLFGFPIPEDDLAAAEALVPAGATITTVSSTPKDWTSIQGILSNIYGIHFSSIGGTK